VEPTSDQVGRGLRVRKGADVTRNRKHSGNKPVSVPLEAKIQAWLEERVVDGTLLSSVRDSARVRRLAAVYGAPGTLPSFPVDSLSRQRVVEAANRVLDHLACLKIVSSTKNISAAARERLLPDLVAANVESGATVLFELKRSRATAREAVTELLAYEHELKNHLPFISSADLFLVVVATEFSVLLDHSLMALMTWERKNILCLRVQVSGTGHFDLAVHLPAAWQRIGQNGLPGDALRTVALATYPKEGEDADFELRKRSALMATEMIVREAERSGSHGFILAWRDTWALKEDQRYHIMVGVLNPFHFFDSAVETGMIDFQGTAIARFLASETGREFALTGAPGHFAICEKAQRLLAEHSEVRFESQTDWPSAREELRYRGHVEHIDFWGVLGDFVRDLVSRPAYRHLHNPAVGGRALSWVHPLVGVPLLDAIAGLPAVSEEALGCQGSFELGKKLQYLLGVAGTIAMCNQVPPPAMEAKFQWAQFDVIPDILEIGAKYKQAGTALAPPPGIQFGPLEEGRAAALAASTSRLIDWIRDHFLGDNNSVSRLFFDLGRKSLPLYEEYVRVALASAELADLRRDIGHLAREVFVRCLGSDAAADDGPAFHSALASFVSASRAQVDESLLLAEAKDLSKQLSDEILAGTLRPHLLRLADTVFPAVRHPWTPGPYLPVDWEWFQQQVVQSWARGETFPAVIRGSGDSIAIGSVPRSMRTALKPIADPEREVYEVIEAHGMYAVVRTTTWADLVKRNRGA
jgi:hypothetical protein